MTFLVNLHVGGGLVRVVSRFEKTPVHLADFEDAFEAKGGISRLFSYFPNNKLSSFELAAASNAAVDRKTL